MLANRLWAGASDYVGLARGHRKAAKDNRCTCVLSQRTFGSQTKKAVTKLNKEKWIPVGTFGCEDENVFDWTNDTFFRVHFERTHSSFPDLRGRACYRHPSKRRGDLSKSR
ncbi:hypothetical protein Poly41_52630 [Novipirellula artificiosorum]|uniref:Uncharacterized protein n=1 Tax=Novipirellula artificiosorum TaxID=2528016 RepID=A0A5C6D9N7_9BACT|nr:hypothetical protein Poly41_52630 [Novipirellula artificiosorum]